MLALRNIARTAPRSAARLSTRVVRPQTSLLRQAPSFQPAWTHSAPRLSASFHISAARRQEANGNQELVAKLQSEISLEEDMKEDADLSTNIKEYLENSPFEMEDKPGHEEVVLTRTFGDEKIRVTFSTSDLNNSTPSDGLEDSAIYDNEADPLMETQPGGANTKGGASQGVNSEPVAEHEEPEDEFGDDNSQGFPARASIRIERPGKGTLAIEATAEDGDFLIQDLSHYAETALADPQSAEQSWKRQALYGGPPFSNLDEDLQILLEKYLEDRGINTRMALFIPDYIDHKEQKEYIRWLNNVKTFVE